jgi:hypothetical protein
MTAASPSPETMPRRAHINCTPAIKGNDTRAVHNRLKPNEAPATEYVAIPEGSSSAAPVITPGPNLPKKCRTEPAARGSGRRFDDFLSGILTGLKGNPVYPVESIPARACQPLG